MNMFLMYLFFLRDYEGFEDNIFRVYDSVQVYIDCLMNVFIDGQMYGCINGQIGEWMVGR